MDSGDTAWMLTSSALVLLMTPGLALFYGGMVRARNALAMLMSNFVAMGIVTVTWILIGYTLAFGPSVGDWGLFGGLDYIGLEDVGASTAIHGAEVPDTVLMAFQMMFAIITPALISGAVAERMKFSAWVLFIAVWSVLVYAPMAHWVWSGEGIIGADLEAIDFAG
ncbi:MAG: ammonium transporter, partial [Gammaproteobacteria bacterium]|nr:ammonium transporter [Gammaproteobacteria bacterium]